MSKKGFTLIELLVVVAVLALLASIVFSNLGGAREGARISNALSFQSQTHSLLGSDLVGWWNFNEGSGTTARDISGYGNNGTIVGATYVDGVPGTGGSALSFNGSSNYVALSYEPFTVSNANYTLSLWAKFDSLSGNRRFISWGSSGSSRYFYGYNGTNDEIDVGQGSITIRPGTTYKPVINIWELWTVSNEETITKFYKNGVLINTVSHANTGAITAGSSVRIGRQYSTNLEWFPGLIDDVRIYSRALTASEIQTLYAQTKDNYLANE